MKNVIQLNLIALLIIFPNQVFAELPKLHYGSSVNLHPKEQVIEIDYNFISELSKNRSIDLVKHNFWEYIYLINLGDRSAISIGFDILIQNPPIDLLHDQDGYRFIATALSQSRQFERELRKKDGKTISGVIKYYENFPNQYQYLDPLEFLKKLFIDENIIE